MKLALGSIPCWMELFQRAIPTHRWRVLLVTRVVTRRGIFRHNGSNY
jgi:hypothetical protein